MIFAIRPHGGAAWAFGLGCLLNAMLAYAEGEPNLGFGSQGFVRYEQSSIPEEPNIERGLQLMRRVDGSLAALAQHRVEDAASENHPLIVVFDGNGAPLRGNLFPAAFFSPPDPALAGVAFDGAGRALAVGDAGAGVGMPLFTAVTTIPNVFYNVEFEAEVPTNPGSGEFHRAIAGLGNGNMLVCGARRHLLPAGVPTWMPMCRMLSAMGGIVASFGNGSPFVPSGTFFINDTDTANLQQGQILSVRIDRQGRILLGGMLRFSTSSQDLVFSARLLASGVFDTSYCAGSVCSDALATAPGWRADAIVDMDQISKSALIERPDGGIAQVLDMRVQSTQQSASALLLYTSNGALSYASPILLGEWTRMGTQLGVQADNKIVVPLSYRPNATTQLGAVLRVPVDPAQAGLFDTAFEFAPVGVTPLPGVSVVRPNLPAGAAATSVECNAILVESGRITCAGLVRVSDAPVNLDLLVAQIMVAPTDALFRDGYE